jgi:hypothetical protein
METIKSWWRSTNKSWRSLTGCLAEKEHREKGFTRNSQSTTFLIKISTGTLDMGRRAQIRFLALKS